LRPVGPSRSAAFGLDPLIHWFSRLATTDVIANSFGIGAILFAIRACGRNFAGRSTFAACSPAAVGCQAERGIPPSWAPPS
jgi:hypothetical protein